MRAGYRPGGNRAHLRFWPHRYTLFHPCKRPRVTVRKNDRFACQRIRSIAVLWTEDDGLFVQPYRRYGRLILHEENWLPFIRSLDTFTAVTNAVCGRHAPSVDCPRDGGR